VIVHGTIVTTRPPYKSFLCVADNADAVEGFVIYVVSDRVARYVASRVYDDLLIFVSLLLFPPQERHR